MIVDDSELTRKILRKDIESSKEFEVCAEASNSFEARDKLLETNPDVISLDISMPGMNGLDFLEKVMQHKPKPVVIVSTLAKAGSPIEKRAMEIGAAGIIDKESLDLELGTKGVRLAYLALLKQASKQASKQRKIL
jgi:two-component system chemotaxis response regulator CheB